MIKHIVMWTIKDETPHGPKAQAIATMKAKLLALNGKIPSLRHLEVGTDIFAASPACDIALYSEFATRADLEAYQVHPLHQEVVAFVKQVAAERRVLDYEL